MAFSTDDYDPLKNYNLDLLPKSFMKTELQAFEKDLTTAQKNEQKLDRAAYLGF
jgi:hypothetical protein